MEIRRAYPVIVALWVVAAVLAMAYALADRTPSAERQVEALPPLPAETRAPASFETDEELPAALAGVAAVPVHGDWTGPGGESFRVAVRPASGAEYRFRRIGTRTFYLPLRLDSAETPQEQCSSCHKAQGVVDGRSAEEALDVHENIQPVHPNQTGAQCLTCHSADDPSRLRLEVGGTTPLNHAYELCAQCHFSQVESWAKGAHGKRLVGWRGQRVVMGCADCHDPHDPGAKQRIPMAGLSLPGELRAEGAEHGEEAGGGTSHD